MKGTTRLRRLLKVDGVQRFSGEHCVWFSSRRGRPEAIELSQQPAPFPPAEVTAHGVPPCSDAAQAVGTDRLPILMYHRVAPTGSPALRAYRVTPEAFEGQLRYLRAAGYSSIRLEDWQGAMAKQKPLPSRAVVITFDDGYRDFLTYAWPLLKRYGFSATVFLVVDEMGRSSHWDRFHGEEAPLLGWREIWQLHSEGVEFGSHSATHRPLTKLSMIEVVLEGARSRAILERELKRPIQAFAYPYGAVDQVVQHLIGACGYVFGLSCQPRLSSFQDSLLMLPRIGVTGTDSLRDFVIQLSK
jgi:peptidoglycan/xylan/chitin deacetylase (PgdA/CDA1 family)